MNAPSPVALISSLRRAERRFSDQPEALTGFDTFAPLAETDNLIARLARVWRMPSVIWVEFGSRDSDTDLPISQTHEFDRKEAATLLRVLRAGGTYIERRGAGSYYVEDMKS